MNVAAARRKQMKTKLIGGVVGMVLAIAMASPATASDAVYAKSAPTATGKVVYISHEHKAARSADADDMKGYEPSLYRGKWYDSKWENSRKCIMKRESRFSYHAANKSSTARGAYQFLDSQWRDGLVWMMLKESKKTKDGLSVEIKTLFDKPIHKWSRYYQDRAFYTAWQNGSGKKHWYYPGHNCY
jgi:muramidase (phage lysozyme)